MAYDLWRKTSGGRDWSIGASRPSDMGVTLLWRTAKAQLESLKAAVDIMNVDISHWYRDHKPTDKEKKFANNWNIWRNQFYSWYKTNVSAWDRMFTTEMPWSVATLVEQKQNELNAWRSEYEKLSGEKATGVAQPISPTAAGDVNWWKWGAIAGSGGVIALLMGHKIKQLINPLG